MAKKKNKNKRKRRVSAEELQQIVAPTKDFDFPNPQDPDELLVVTAQKLSPGHLYATGNSTLIRAISKKTKPDSDTEVAYDFEEHKRMLQEGAKVLQRRIEDVLESDDAETLPESLQAVYDSDAERRIHLRLNISEDYDKRMLQEGAKVLQRRIEDVLESDDAETLPESLQATYLKGDQQIILQLHIPQVIDVDYDEIISNLDNAAEFASIAIVDPETLENIYTKEQCARYLPPELNVEITEWALEGVRPMQEGEDADEVDRFPEDTTGQEGSEP